MKTIRQLTALPLAAILFVGAPLAQHGTPPGGSLRTLDGTTAKSFKTSIERARRSLPAPDQQRFDDSMKLGRRLFGDEETFRKMMHGTPVQRALELGAQMRKHLDTDRDGEISDREMQVAMAEIKDARVNANESAAIATLRNCVSAQEQARAAGVIDVDGNGMGEFAFFAEMTGVAGVRDETGASGLFISPPLLSSHFAVKDGLVERSGYLFQIWLPAADGTAVAEGKHGGVGAAAPGAENSEMAWCAYAWPVENGVSGNRAFFVTQDGDVYHCDNKTQEYGGRDKRPSPYAAFPEGVKTLGFLPRRLPKSNDEGDWKTVY